MTAAALDADVLLIRSAPGKAVAGRPGRTLADWIADGDAEHGWPTREDLDYHLTTLFFEVRPRGFLEIRSIDALPTRLRDVPAALYAGLLYDEARHQVLRVLEPHRGALPELLERVAIDGVADLHPTDPARALAWASEPVPTDARSAR